MGLPALNALGYAILVDLELVVTELIGHKGYAVLAWLRQRLRRLGRVLWRRGAFGFEWRRVAPVPVRADPREGQWR
jgi:hypothetical protein